VQIVLVVEERVFIGMGSAIDSAEESVCPGLVCHEFMSPYYDKLFQIKHNISIFPKFSSTIMPVIGIFSPPVHASFRNFSGTRGLESL
jgi:hypothetical protein